MADIDTDQLEQYELMNIPKTSAFLAQERAESRTFYGRFRQSPENKSKTADTVRTSVTGTTLVIDPDLKVGAEVNSRWLVRGTIFILGQSTNGDIDITLGGPTGAGGFFKVDGSTAKNALAARAEQDVDVTAVARSIEGIITLDATHPGDIGLFWSQHASHADQVIVQAGSFMSFMRMANG